MSFDEEELNNKNTKKVQLPRFDWLPILKRNKFFGKQHSHTKENARRRKQIEKGTLAPFPARLPVL